MFPEQREKKNVLLKQKVLGSGRQCISKRTTAENKCSFSTYDLLGKYNCNTSVGHGVRQIYIGCLCWFWLGLS